MNSSEVAIASFILSSISLTASLAVLVVTILNYRRQRRFDNENHIFKTKIDDYKIILQEITELFKLFPAESELSNLLMNRDKIESIAQKIDDAIIKLSFLIVPYSIVLHPDVLKAIEELINYFIDGDIEKQSESDIKAELEKAHNKTNQIIALIRKDIYSDELNKRLVKRLE